MKNILNDELLKKSIEKIKIYQTDENNQLSNIKRIIDGIGYNYKSTNTNKIEELNLLISTKFNTMRNIHSNNIYVLNHNIDKYRNVRVQVENKFNNIV